MTRTRSDNSEIRVQIIRIIRKMRLSESENCSRTVLVMIIIGTAIILADDCPRPKALLGHPSLTLTNIHCELGDTENAFRERVLQMRMSLQRVEDPLLILSILGGNTEGIPRTIWRPRVFFFFIPRRLGNVLSYTSHTPLMCHLSRLFMYRRRPPARIVAPPVL